LVYINIRLYCDFTIAILNKYLLTTNKIHVITTLYFNSIGLFVEIFLNYDNMLRIMLDWYSYNHYDSIEIWPVQSLTNIYSGQIKYMW